MDRGRKPVVWTTRATNDLEIIAKFYISLYGYATTRKILTDLRKSTEILEREHKIGAVDEAFLHLKRNYRKLVNYHCKITYRVGKTKIYVVRAFDTRQDPNKNK